MAQGSLLQFAPITPIYKLKKDKRILSDYSNDIILKEYQNVHQRYLPLNLDSSSNFIYQTRTSFNKPIQTSKKIFMKSKMGNKEKKIKSGNTVNSKFRSDISMTMFQNYGKPPDIAQDNLKKKHYLLRSIVKARQQSQQYNQNNQINESLDRMNSVYKQQNMLHPNRMLPQAHLKKQQQYQKQFNIQRSDNVPIVDIFRRPQNSPQMIRQGKSFKYQNQQIQKALDLNKIKHFKAYQNLLRNQNMNRWFIRRCLIKTQKPFLKKKQINQRYSLMHQIRTAVNASRQS